MKYNYEYIASVYTGGSRVLPFAGDVKRSDKIPVECKQHGIYMQAVSSIINSCQCRQCYFESKKGKFKYTTKSWISKAKAVHNNFYQYDKSVFTGIDQKITIICPSHGEFDQTAIAHLNGHKCKKCYIGKSNINRSYNQHQFIAAATAKHGNKYDYTKTVFTGSRNTVIVTCAVHGDFEQVAYYHTHGNGCPECGKQQTTYKSKPEYEIIDFVKSLGVDCVLHSDRSLGFELDVLIPSHQIAIEYNGLYWHSSNKLSTDLQFSKQHIHKTQICAEHGVKLLHIFENEWLDTIQRNIWKSIIKHALGQSTRVYARNCTVKPLDTETANAFFNQHHLQGCAIADSAYGLCVNDFLVSAISVAQRGNCLEIIRFCNRIGHTSVGGFSKLLAYISKFNQLDIVVRANRRYSNGKLYCATGFVLACVHEPEYYYIGKKLDIQHQSAFPSSTSAIADVMYNNGYRRIWDSGNLEFIRYKNV